MQIERDTPTTMLRTCDPVTFQDAVRSSFVPLQFEVPDDTRFTGSIATACADGVMFAEITASSGHVERTLEAIARGGSGYYKLSLLLSGSGLLVQSGRSAVMGPGELLFYETSSPYSLGFDGQFRNLVMMFPKDRLELPSALVDTLTAVPLVEQHPLVGVVSSFLAQSSPHLANLSDRAAARLVNATVDLVTVMLAAVLDLETEPRRSHTTLLQRIQEHIVENLGSRDLTPSSIATAHYVSVRRLHSLFEKDGSTVGTWIRTRRLERCREDLLNPGFSHRGIAEIAASWGFPDAAHFSRAFRVLYGLSPSELRRLGELP
ncbi:MULTISPECIES: helix-turn-helix domain-containing protein [unclassified Mycolicibacterium]|uniref:AraC-like ligand-binding domain-containing protein n=1 Tax=unclassified Mycolicibacterium TaxID=2636767 RepID=UPI0012DD5F98|nr:MULTISPECIES: helix-turn-helix domain-containing protein [unclassified Mycolicibacterium]MUL82975.1 helix-turn-helix domain-containing protein [Mycolicibacterium sp. CBMA 329]MUL89310.1 helix-turn-helix domain-containing protein [Mycolicibacterium sp. CBMA 331]MUM02777.1 helix-turn-helix domain-containing protein [Mycolicibacterium sp. CBMA 334]MUM25703.1 helix-turn-helix domain-containing protein [Mycolicibacterium sp. CBMA 295]MUM38826.1 helix-turn-helix domain-containing protein [Mycolic